MSPVGVSASAYLHPAANGIAREYGQRVSRATTLDLIMGRTKKYEVDVVLDRAVEMFREHGYLRLSMREIADYLRISRTSVYSTFGGKRMLFVQAVRRYGAEIRVAGLSELMSAESPRAALVKVFEVAAAGGAGTCLLIDTAMEQKRPDPEIAGIVQEAIRAMATRFQAAIERGQIAGEIAVSVEPLQTARGLLGLYLGLYMLVRSGTAKEPVLGAVLEEVKGLLPASATPEGA